MSHHDVRNHLHSHLEPLFDDLNDSKRTAPWVDVLRESVQRILLEEKNGHFEKWANSIQGLPQLTAETVDFNSPAVQVRGPQESIQAQPSDALREQLCSLRSKLMGFHPWRKGPFDLFGIHVDSEWRSDLKWQRVMPHVDLKDKFVLDVGCGNGYYGWRMAGCGARRIVGIEPYPLYVMQHLAIQTYLPKQTNYVVAANDEVLSLRLETFDVAFSMGVLYHARDPIGHLEKMRSAIKPGGLFVLETLVVDGCEDTIFIPPGRYAKMRNVWLLPSPLAIEKLLKRVGFRAVELVDVTTTTTEEQRQTSWMTFESLANFLSPDRRQTVEGHPAPKRAIFLAQ